MFAVMYDENRVVKINGDNEYEFRNYEQVQTFEEGRRELIAYWGMIKSDAASKINEAKKLREE